MKKILLAIMLVMVIAATTVGVYADKITVVAPTYNDSLVPDKIEKATKNIWATVVILVRVAAVACVVFAGLRYMFASADQKADIKQGLIFLTIGAILVFSSTYIITFVVNVVNDIVK